MCEEMQACPYKTERMCTCAPVRDRENNALELIGHIASNMTDIRWELAYTDLNRSEKRRLCCIGTCRICGGILCYEVDEPDYLVADDLLAAVYRRLHQLHSTRAESFPQTEFYRKFAELFHEQDRPAVYEWLNRIESSRVSRMYRQSGHKTGKEQVYRRIRLYTIVRTGADADRGYFSDPQSEGSFLSQPFARIAFQQLVDDEKETLDSRYDSEEQGVDYWEAYQEGYAAALFTRLEILSSDLIIVPGDEQLIGNLQTDRLKQCSESQSVYKDACRKDSRGEQSGE